MQLHIARSTQELNHSVADWLVQYIHKTLQTQNRFTIVLSGGSTPKKLYELLASGTYKNKIEWGKLHFFWGDERFVPLNDDRNNAKMAFDTLLNHVPVVKEQVHVIQTENISPEDSAKQYEQLLHQYFSTAHNPQPTTFDLVLLGMGDDGHTLSLFPGTEVVNEKDKWVTSLWLASQNMYRVTLTAPVVNIAARVAFVAAGEKKAIALKEVLKGEKNISNYPSQTIRPAGPLHWFVDEPAAALL